MLTICGIYLYDFNWFKEGKIKGNKNFNWKSRLNNNLGLSRIDPWTGTYSNACKDSFICCTNFHMYIYHKLKHKTTNNLILEKECLPKLKFSKEQCGICLLPKNQRKKKESIWFPDMLRKVYVPQICHLFCLNT